MIHARRQNMGNPSPGANLWLASESHTILEMVDVHVSLISKQLTVLWSNHKAKELFGQNMVGKQCCDVYSCPQWVDGTQSLCLIKNAFFEGNTQEQEINLVTDNNKERFFLGTVQVVSKDKDGLPMAIALIYKDITEQKIAREELEKSMLKLKKNISGTIQAMNKAVEIRDPYTAGHQERTMSIARGIAKTMGLDKRQVDGIGMAGAIHDLGKLCTPLSILSKPGRINPSELTLIKDHPEAGFNILKDLDFDTPVAQTVLQHHERLDGSGYPFGLGGDDIILEARVVGVADVIEAMASTRPYRPALGMDKALQEIKLNSGKLYDPVVVNAAVDLFANGEQTVYNA
ncbi:MAG: HD-GYP domain-containing protein [Thermodesulfobacteriota bacterium]